MKIPEKWKETNKFKRAEWGTTLADLSFDLIWSTRRLLVVCCSGERDNKEGAHACPLLAVTLSRMESLRSENKCKRNAEFSRWSSSFIPSPPEKNPFSPSLWYWENISFSHTSIFLVTRESVSTKISFHVCQVYVLIRLSQQCLKSFSRDIRQNVRKRRREKLLVFVCSAAIVHSVRLHIKIVSVLCS